MYKGEATWSKIIVVLAVTLILSYVIYGQPWIADWLKMWLTAFILAFVV